MKKACDSLPTVNIRWLVFFCEKNGDFTMDCPNKNCKYYKKKEKERYFAGGYFSDGGYCTKGYCEKQFRRKRK